MSPARAEDGLVLRLRRAAAMLLTALRQTVEVLVRSMVIDSDSSMSTAAGQRRRMHSKDHRIDGEW